MGAPEGAKPRVQGKRGELRPQNGPERLPRPPQHPRCTTRPLVRTLATQVFIPVGCVIVVLPPRHMTDAVTAAPRHRQSRSARLRGQQRPSDDRLASDRWARSLSGPSPACRSPVRLAARGPLACSPPPPRVPAPPRFPVHLTALELRTDGALWQTEQRPPRRSLLRPVRVRPPARATAAAAAAPPDPRVS